MWCVNSENTEIFSLRSLNASLVNVIVTFHNKRFKTDHRSADYLLLHPAVTANSTYPSQLNAAGQSLLWWLRLFWQIRPLPSNKHSVGACMCSCGLGGPLGHNAPWGVCSWEGLLFGEHPEALPPSCSVCACGETELGKPQHQRGQFVVWSWVCCCLGKHCSTDGELGFLLVQ